MDPLASDRWAEIDTLFAEALDRPPDERTAFLRAACGHDPALYHALAALLAADADADAGFGESATDFADHLLREAAVAPDAPGDLAPGTRVGAYRIEEELGRGGMGVVYRAARADGAFTKDVALKLVKRGMDTDEVLRRFRYERQVLAGLDHPHVARLLDAGADADGRPYLVMERVEGEPITRYAEAHALDLDERLALFEQVCEAVAYAHRHLVVHRDLKPSNILVAEAEGAPQVKLLDFGIARLLDGEPEDAPRTRPEQRILTPEYAAPEQLDGAAVTTATDVYALGVVLFELLAGRRPAPRERLSETVPAGRQRAVRGDLDVLAATALHEDPARRYPTAEALLEDLRHRREGLPLAARPEATAYRLRKFIARHRVGVGVGASFVVLLMASVVLLTVQQQRTARALAEAEATADFLESTYAATDPYSPQRLDTLRVGALLDRNAARAREELGGQPLLQARLFTVLGRVYLRQARHADADTLLQSALAIRRARLGPADPATAETLHELAWARYWLDDYGAAEAMAREALAIRRRHAGPSHPDVAASLTRLGRILQEVGRGEEAARLHRTALDMYRATQGPGSRNATGVATNLASTYLELGRLDSALVLQREIVQRRQAHDGPDHPDVGNAYHWLAFYLLNTGAFAEGEQAARAALRIRAAAFGDTHPEVSVTLNLLGLLLRRQQRYAEAEAVLQRSLALTRRPGHEVPVQERVALSALARLYREAGALDAAERAQREALDRTRTYSDNAINEAMDVSHLADILREKGAFREAESLLLDSHRALEASAAPPMERRQIARGLAALYDAWGRSEEAARWRADPPDS